MRLEGCEGRSGSHLPRGADLYLHTESLALIWAELRAKGLHLADLDDPSTRGNRHTVGIVRSSLLQAVATSTREMTREGSIKSHSR